MTGGRRSTRRDRTPGHRRSLESRRDRAHQLGDDFTLKQFMDEFQASGMIPISLIRWEMTGLQDEIRELW